MPDREIKMNNILDFLRIAERLHYEKRTLQMGNGEKQPVSSHSWMMSIMALCLAPKLPHSIDIGKVLKLCAVHDLAESRTKDIPLHQQEKIENIKDKKLAAEMIAMQEFQSMLGTPTGNEIYELWHEYEKRETYEAQFVKILDLLDVCVQLACSQTIDYMGEYDDAFYWRRWYNKKYIAQFDFAPATREFFDTIQSYVESRMIEAGINPEQYK